MAISMNSDGGNGSSFGMRRRQRGGGSLSEINVTPFVDVVLVLLIIFMITAHAMDFGLEVDVPKTRYVKETAQDLPIVSIPKDGSYYLGGKAVNINEMKSAILQRYGKNTKAVYVMADRTTVWDVIAQMTSQLNADGFQILMVMQPMDAPAKGRK